MIDLSKGQKDRTEPKEVQGYSRVQCGYAPCRIRHQQPGTPKRQRSSPPVIRVREAEIFPMPGGGLRLSHLFLCPPLSQRNGPGPSFRRPGLQSGVCLLSNVRQVIFSEPQVSHNDIFFLPPLGLLRYCVGKCIETKFQSTIYTNVTFYYYYCCLLIQLLTQEDSIQGLRGRLRQKQLATYDKNRHKLSFFPSQAQRKAGHIAKANKVPCTDLKVFTLPCICRKHLENNFSVGDNVDIKFSV